MGQILEQTFTCKYCHREITVISHFGAMLHEIWCASIHTKVPDANQEKT